MTLKLGDYCVQSARLAKYCFDPPVPYHSSFNQKAEGITLAYIDDIDDKRDILIKEGIRKWSLASVMDGRFDYRNREINKFSELLDAISTTLGENYLKNDNQRKFIAEALEWGLRTL